MRLAVVGSLAVVVLSVVGAAVLPSVGFAQRGPSCPTSGGALITVATPAGDHREQLAVIDPETRSLAVYHIDTSSGEISLKSVRNIYYDLRMSEFNGTSPLPREVRSMVELK